MTVSVRDWFPSRHPEKRPTQMSSDPNQIAQQKMQEFLRLLPITSEIAGLPRAEPGKFLTEGQLEVRVQSLKNAFKLAKQLLREIGQ